MPIWSTNTTPTVPPVEPGRPTMSPEEVQRCEESRAANRVEGDCPYCAPYIARRDAGWNWDEARRVWVEPFMSTWSWSPTFRTFNTASYYTQESDPEEAPMPVEHQTWYPVGTSDRMTYCGGCDLRVAERRLMQCSEDGEWICDVCRPRHDHSGERCDDCNFNMLNGEATEVCEGCNNEACRSHMRSNHMGCAMGGYDGRDDGQYSGRPPIDGYGREASMDFIDEDFVPHPLAQGKRAAAVELEVEYDDGFNGRERVFLPPSVGIGHDGSLHNGIEVTTPPSNGAVLADVLLETTRILKENGYVARETCGMHTHIDLRDKKDDKRFLSHLFNAFFAVEDILYAMQGERRYANTYSVPLRNKFKFFDMYGQKSGDFDYTFYNMPKTLESKYQLDREKSQKYGTPRYAAFNFHSVYFRGSLECRLHEGTVNGEDALMWIDLLQSIIARVEQGHSYKVMLNLAKQKVTRKKVNAFARYFRLTDEQKEFVIRRIDDGQGFGFKLPRDIEWGVPVKGRPTREPRLVPLRLSFVGERVQCANCSHHWVLRASSRECPRCLYNLIDRYGSRNYYRAVRVPLPSYDFDDVFETIVAS